MLREQRKWLFSATVLLGLVLLPAAAAEPTIKRHRVAVLDFEERGELVEAETGQIAAELLTTGLVNTGRFEVVERDRLQQVIREQQFGTSDMVSPETAARIGNLVGVEVIITGTVYRLRDVSGMSAKLISTQDGGILTAEETRGDAMSTVHDLVDELLPLLIDDFPLEGYVVRHEAGEVIIDMGADYGLQPGLEFDVYVPGKELRHPVTNEVLDREELHKGRIRVVSVGSRTSECVVIEEAETIERGHLIKSVGFEARQVEPPVRPPASVRPEPAATSLAPAITLATAPVPIWEPIPGKPTILLLDVVDAPKGFNHGHEDTLLEILGDALHRARLAHPVMSEIRKEPEYVKVPDGYDPATVLLLQVEVDEWKLRARGDNDIELTCRVFEPGHDSYMMKQTASFEVERKDYVGGEQEMLKAIMQKFADRVARKLSRY